MKLRTKLVYNDKTGMFEEVPVGGWFSRLYLLLFLLIRIVLQMLCFPVRALMRMLGFPVIVLKRIFSFFWRKLIILLGLFFYPAVKLGHIIRRDWCEGDYVFVGLWLIPGYVLFLIYKSLIFWALGTAWLLLMVTVAGLRRWMCAIWTWTYGIVLSVFAG